MGMFSDKWLRRFLGQVVQLTPAVFWLVAPTPNAYAGETVAITTLEWPPYTGQALPRNGATSDVVARAFDKAGVAVNLQVLPWKRAISTAKNGDPVAYFPGYHCSHTDGFVASDPIGNGPLGLVERKEKPYQWQSVGDLATQKVRIGTVLGYSNTKEFDQRVQSGELSVVPAKNDVTNLRKLMRGRIDMAVIDKLVLSYLLASDPTLKSGADSLQFNETPLEMKVLHLCFVDSEKGRALRDRFNEGLKQVDVDTVVSDYFANEF